MIFEAVDPITSCQAAQDGQHSGTDELCWHANELRELLVERRGSVLQCLTPFSDASSRALGARDGRLGPKVRMRSKRVDPREYC